MPLMLMTAEDVDRWLNGSSIEDTVAMQRPRLRWRSRAGTAGEAGEEGGL